MATHGAELWQLVVEYAKQETVEPLSNLFRFVAFGLVGSVLIGIGAVLLDLSLLRALQTETGSRFTGNSNWMPYFITLLVTALLLFVTFWSIGKDKRRIRKEDSK